MILGYLGKKRSADGKDKLSQKALAKAKYMNTDAQGSTNFNNSTGSNDMARGLNTWWGSRKWVSISGPSVRRFKGALLSDINAGKPFAAGTYESDGTGHYNNHPDIGRPIHHWIVVRGYRDNRATTYFLDPATYWPNVAKRFEAPTSAFVGAHLQVHGIVS